MYEQDFRNVADYLAEFQAMLRIEQDTHDRTTFEVEVREALLDQDEIALLQ